MHVMFFGTAEFAVPSLERLVERGHSVLLCVTQPDRPQGRGLNKEPSPMKRAAQRLRLPLVQPERPSLESLGTMRPDIGVVAAYGRRIPRDVLGLPPHGMLGVHPSLLPKYRGAAPVAWALLNGETVTGVTIFRLTEHLDDGEIVAHREVTIEPGEDAAALTARLAQLGAEELLRAVEAIAAGRAVFTPQDHVRATLAPKFTKAQGQIDWQQPAEVIERLVRAAVPWPGASSVLNGMPVRIGKVSVASRSDARTDEPGAVIRAGPDTLEVATGRGVLAIHELQPAGRRRMTAREFLAGHPLRVGDRLGVVSDQ